MSAREQYFVVRHEDQWKIKYNGSHIGAYKTQQDAMDAARILAQKAHDNGSNSQVLVQGKNMQFQTEWSYGEDPRDVKG